MKGLLTASFVFICIAGAAFASGGEQGGSEHGVPFRDLGWHAFNLAILVGVFCWALFGKIKVPEMVVQRRQFIQNEIITSKNEKHSMDQKFDFVKAKLQTFAAEEKRIIQRAEVQGAEVSSKIVNDAEGLAKKLVEDAKLAARQEVTRMKEQVVTEIVELALQEAKKVIEKGLDKINDKELIEKELDKMELQ